MGNDENSKVNWNDESGEIHTTYQEYEITPEDGFQENRAHAYINALGRKNRYIKGIQKGATYVTDDYRKVLPGYIIVTILVIVIAVVLLLIPNLAFRMIGVFFAVFGAIFIFGFWKNAPIKKWKAQAKRIKEEKGE